MSTTPALPGAFVALVDDAAIFPPGNAPVADAVREHLEHRAAAYAEFVGPFVVSDVRLPELLEVLETPRQPLPVAVVVTGGAGAVEPAVRWATGSAAVELAALEVTLRDLDDLAGSARRVVAAADLGVDVPVYVELPLGQGTSGHGWLAALDELAAADLRVKLRTGGLEAAMFPSAGSLASAIDAALDRELAFKCTAGLHHAVRHRDEGTGFEHHGFLNVLLATRASLDGDDAVEVLEDRDRGSVLARVEQVGDDGLARARRWFTSFGCCEVCDPLEELVDLTLIRV